MDGARPVSTQSGPSTRSAARCSSRQLSGSLTSGGTPSSTAAVQLPPKVRQKSSPIRAMASRCRRRTWLSRVRRVPRRVTVFGMILGAVPPWISPKVSTTGSVGLLFRLTRVWSCISSPALRTTGSTHSSGWAPWPPFPVTSRRMLSQLALAIPSRMEMVPRGRSGAQWKPTTASGVPSRNRPWLSMAAAPSKVSSPHWKISSTSPHSSSRRRASSLAQPSRAAAWTSWPQAWHTPGVWEAKGSPVFSRMGRASMSSRRASSFPGCPPRMRTASPVGKP